MQPDMLDVDRLSQVISHATAPAFLLGAVAGFISILITRMNGIIDRIRVLNATTDGDTVRAHLKADLPRLERRAKMINDAIFLALASGICTTLLVLLAFASAFLNQPHEPAAAFLFIIAMGLLGVSLLNFAREVKIALHEHEHYA